MHIASVNLGPIIEKTMVCAGSITDLPQDSCQADIGGTVMNEMGAQVGCHFIWNGLCTQGHPGINARTSQKWLSDSLCNLTRSSALDECCGKVDAKPAQHQTPQTDSTTTHQTTERDSLTTHQTTKILWQRYHRLFLTSRCSNPFINNTNHATFCVYKLWKLEKLYGFARKCLDTRHWLV